MLLNNDLAGFSELFNTVTSFYTDFGARRFLIFENQMPSEDSDEGYFVRYLLDRRHVCEYRVAHDRGCFLSILSLAIGPHYFPPEDFWSYDNSQRFRLEASTEAVLHNLGLLDEFLAGR